MNPYARRTIHRVSRVFGYPTALLSIPFALIGGIIASCCPLGIFVGAIPTLATASLGAFLAALFLNYSVFSKREATGAGMRVGVRSAVISAITSGILTTFTASQIQFAGMSGMFEGAPSKDVVAVGQGAFLSGVVNLGMLLLVVLLCAINGVISGVIGAAIRSSAAMDKEPERSPEWENDLKKVKRWSLIEWSVLFGLLIICTLAPAIFHGLKGQNNQQGVGIPAVPASDVPKSPSESNILSHKTVLSKRLYECVARLDLAGTEKVITEGADPNFPNSEGSGESVLHLAAASGNGKMVELLLEKGAAINALNEQGETALHAAVSANSLVTARLLVEKGADVAIRAKNQQNAADRCIPHLRTPEGIQIFRFLTDAMKESGELVLVPGGSEIPAAAQTPEEDGLSPEAKPGKVTNRDRINSIKMEYSAESGETVWSLDGKELLKSQHPGDGAKNISPGGSSVHFGSMKLNSNFGTIVAFHTTTNGKIISYGTQSLPEKVGSLLENDSRLVGKEPIYRCWVRPVEWIDDSRLLISAYVSAPGTSGFELSDYRCVWYLETDKCVYDESQKSPNEKITYNQLEPAVNFEGEIHPETRSKVLVESDVSNWNKEQLQFAINEMFARHGLYFKKNETRDLFARHSWYHPDPSLSMDKIEENFSEIEKKNLKLLGELRSHVQTKAAANPGNFGDLGGNPIGKIHGVQFVEDGKSKGFEFRRERESRIDYSFESGFPDQGTIEFRINVKNGYGYSNGTLNRKTKNALIFTTVGPDTWYPGAAWLTVSDDGGVKLGMATGIGGQTPNSDLAATGSKFRFNEWHSVGISYGEKGRAVNVDGVVVARDTFRGKLGPGGNLNGKIDKIAIGEFNSSVFPNNMHDSGFDGLVERIRVSRSQEDWVLCK